MSNKISVFFNRHKIIHLVSQNNTVTNIYTINSLGNNFLLKMYRQIRRYLKTFVLYLCV